MAMRQQHQRRRGVGLRSTLQQAQLEAKLAHTALHLPPLSRSKPLLFLMQLHPLLLLLSGASGRCGSPSRGAEGSDDDSPSRMIKPSLRRTEAAVRQLRRLTAVDGQGQANEWLLFWLLAVLMWRGLEVGEAEAAGGGSALGELRSTGVSRGSSGGSSSESEASSSGGEEKEGVSLEEQRHLRCQVGTARSQAQALQHGCSTQADTAVWLQWHLAPGPFLELMQAMGWEELLEAALAFHPGWEQRLLPHCPAGHPALQRLLLAGVAAQVAGRLEQATAWQERVAGMAAPAAGATVGAASSSAAAGTQRFADLDQLASELADDMELLLEGLLACQADGPLGMPTAQGGQLRRLSAAAEACAASLLSLSQHRCWSQPHQRLFQQLCQLRARLALLQLGAAGAHSAGVAVQAAQAMAGMDKGGGAAAGFSVPCAGAAAAGATAAWECASVAAGDAWQVWRAVLELCPPRPRGAAAGPAAQDVGAPTEQQAGSGRSSGSGRSPVFLAAQAAAWQLLAGEPPGWCLEQPTEGQAQAPAAAEARPDMRNRCSQGDPTMLTAAALSSSPQLQSLSGFVNYVAALPGVIFTPPPLRIPAAPASPQPGQARTLRHAHSGGLSSAKARPGNGEGRPPLEGSAKPRLAGEPNPLGPAGLVLASLQLATQQLHPGAASQAKQRDGSASVEASAAVGGQEGLGATGPAGPLDRRGRARYSISGQWEAAAADVCTLLWLAAGAAAQVDGRRQQRALLQYFLHEGGFGPLRHAVVGDAALQDWCRRGLVALSNRMADTGAAVQVFGDERQRVSNLVQEVLPFALLAPVATIERLLSDAITHAGQAGTVVEALAELPPLAFYSHPSSPASTHLTDCLCACLAGPLEQFLAPGPPGSPPMQPFWPVPSLLTSPAHSQAFLALAVQLCSTSAAVGGQALVRPDALLRRAVLPALQPQRAAGGRPHTALALALQLACALLGCGGTCEQAAGIAPLVAKPMSRSDADVAWLLLGRSANTAAPPPPNLASDALSSSSGGGSRSPGAISGLPSCAGSSSGGDCLAVQLLGPLLRLLDFSSRQLGASAAALLTPLECYGLARALVQCIVGVLVAGDAQGGSGSPSSDGELGFAWHVAAAGAPLADLGLPDAWLHLGPLLAATAWGTAALKRQQPLPPLPAENEPDRQQRGYKAAARLLQLCAADGAMASWATEQAQQVCFGLREVAAAVTSPTLLQQEQHQPKQQLPLPAARQHAAEGARAQAAQLVLAIEQLPLPEARQALVVACAATLPVCTPAEAGWVLGGGLPLVVATVVERHGAQQSQHGSQQLQQRQYAALQVAVLEVACKGLHLLALHPASCPVAGEQLPGAGGGQQGGSMGQGGGPGRVGPGRLRQVAVERAMRHISAYCQGVTCWPLAATVPLDAAGSACGGSSSGSQRVSAARDGAEGTTASSPPPGGADSHAPTLTGTQAAVALRAFQEVCRVAAALQPFYPCSTLQVCLLHLLQVLRGQQGGRLHAETSARLQEWASALQGQTGETLRFALEELDGEEA